MTNYLVFSKQDFSAVQANKFESDSNQIQPVAHEIASALFGKIIDDSNDIIVCQTETQLAKSALKNAAPLCRFSLTSKTESKWSDFYQPVFESYMELRDVEMSCYQEITNYIDKLNIYVESVECANEFEDFDKPSLRNLGKAFNYLDSTFKSDFLEFIVKEYKVLDLRVALDDLTEEDYFDVPAWC